MSDKKYEPKMIYKSEPAYDLDINDLVEDEEISKGGVGSGQKGHVTIRQHNLEQREKKALASGRMDQIRGLAKIHHSEYKAHKKAGNTEHADYHRKKFSELSYKVMDHISNMK